jgi:hypothetical protein
MRPTEIISPGTRRKQLWLFLEKLEIFDRFLRLAIDQLSHLMAWYPSRRGQTKDR